MRSKIESRRRIKNTNQLQNAVQCVAETLERRLFLSAVSWTGAGDGTNWTDPTNWNTNAVPGSTDDVVIASPGTTVNITTNTTVASIQSTANLDISNSLSVTSGVSSETGALTVEVGASLSASGSGTVFQATGATAIDVSSLYASNGATLSLPGVTSDTYSNSGYHGHQVWQASGAGSQIVLANLTGLNAVYFPLDLVAQSGGEVSLPALTTIVNSQVYASADGNGSIINLPQLGSFSTVNSNSNIGTLSATGGGQVIDPLLTSAVAVNLTLSGAGSQMNTSQLTNLTYGSITVDQAVNFSALADIDASSLYVSNGATLSLPGVTSYAYSNSRYNGFQFWQASGAGNQIVLANLTGLNAVYFPLDLVAQSGGEVSLPALTTIVNSQVYASADGNGSIINLPQLGSFSTVNSNSNIGTLSATGGGQVIDPLLTSAVAVNLTLSGAGSQMNTSQLTNLTYGSITVDQAVNFSALADIDASSLYVSNGATLSLPGVTSYAYSNSRYNGFQFWQASGAGNQIVLANLTDMSNVYFPLFLQAQSGGKVSLPALTTIVNSQVYASADGNGSIINLPQLGSFSTVNSNSNIGTLSATGGGQVIDPLLTSAVAVNLTLSGAGSQMNTSQLTNLTYGSITVDQAVNFSALADIDASSLYVSNGATLSLPGVTSYAYSNSRYNGFQFWQASGAGNQIVLANLTDMSNVYFPLFLQAQSGGKVSLPALTTIVNSQVYASADGNGSIINLPQLGSFSTVNSNSNIGTLSATGGGQVNLPSNLATVNVQISFDAMSYIGIANLMLGGGSSLIGTGTFNPTSTAGTAGGPAGTFTIAAGVTIQGGGSISNSTAGNPIVNQGTIDADVSGATLTVAGNGSSFTNTGTLEGTAGGTLAIASPFAVGSLGNFETSATGIIQIQNNLLGTTTNTAGWNQQGKILFDGSGNSSSPQLLEAMSQDDGATTGGLFSNFAYGSLNLSNGTYVQLVDQAQNAASGSNAVYAKSITVPAGCTLDLNGLHVYAINVQVDGTILNGTISKPQNTNTTTVVTSNLATTNYGQSAIFTATVTPAAGSGETGVVQFKIDNGSFGDPVPLNGNTVTLAISTLAPGSHSIVALYSGDDLFNGSTSAVFTQNVSTTPSTILPVWLTPGSAATWNPATQILTVTGTVTIVADPGLDEPGIVADGAAAQVTITANGATHANSITLTNGAKVTVAESGSHVSDGFGGIASYGNTLSQANTKVLVLNSLSIPVAGGSNTVQGTLDLTNNAMILNYSGSSAAALNSADGLTQSGSDDGVWDGTGVTSSNAQADANNNGYTAIGVAANSDLGYVHFAGQDVSGNNNQQILLMYTYYGNGTLTGSASNGDLLSFEAGRPNNPGGVAGTGWEYGIYDYGDSPAGSNADLLLFEQGQLGYKANGAINGGGTYT